MPDVTQAPDVPENENFTLSPSTVTRSVVWVRFVVGLLQGFVLYWLYFSAQQKGWAATDKQVFAPLMLIALFIPPMLVSSLGHVDKKRMGIWMATATAIAGVLGFYDVWRIGFQSTHDASSVMPSMLLIAFTAVGFYIAHALVLAAAFDGRRIARYSTYFEIAWKFAIQIKFAALFIGILWLILWLGAALFILLKLDFLQMLLGKSWFAIPITAVAFSFAFHITDVRSSLVRGIRTLLLMLMSWLLPIAVFLVGGFLFSLPFTGLAPLWATRQASAVLLGAAATLVVLINAAFQNGGGELHLARIVRVSARIAAVLLIPIVGIAIYSLGLRIQEYGWTADRVIAAMCLLVASCYAGGYAYAAIGKGAWLGRIAPTNIAAAFLVLAVLFALFSPVADPARLSVAHQMRRLETGKISAAKFDFDYLKFEGARYGMNALARLKTFSKGADPAFVREHAQATLQKQNRWAQEVVAPNDIAANITLLPGAFALPNAFFNQNWSAMPEKWQLPQCLTTKNKKCTAYSIDLSGDRHPEILLMGAEDYDRAVIFMLSPVGVWEIAGTLPQSLAGCNALQQLLAKGVYRVVPPTLNDIEVAGQRLYVRPHASSNVKCDVWKNQ